MYYSFHFADIFPPLVYFFPKYLIDSDAVVKGSGFLISLADNLLLVCRNATDFCMLALYLAVSLN